MLGRTELRFARRKVARQRGHLAAERPVESRDEGADCLPAIRHIVVLMMENHSYDNYLGMLGGRGDGFTLGQDGKPLATEQGTAGYVPLTHTATTQQQPSVPSQSWNASHIQWNKGSCDGFVRSLEQTVPGKDATAGMRYWTEADIPFYYGLARTFPLATRWFCSCLGPTFPNRRFLIAGTANGLIDDLPFGMLDYPAAGTIFDLLSAHGISWANYHNVKRWQLNLKRVIRPTGVNILRLIGAILSSAFPSWLTAVQSKLQATGDLYPLGTLRSINHLRTMRQFFADAQAGTLPAVSVVDPDFGEWSEENPQDIQKGEAFAAKVINAVMAGKGWQGTVLIWVYDEHGGYYDHVPPPPAPAPDNVPAGDPLTRSWALRLLLRWTAYAKQIAAIDSGPTTYEQLGFRVPAVVVSPHAKPVHVSNTVYDHTSILKLVEEKWNLPALTNRDAAATSPLDMLDLEAPPAFLTPPTLPASARTIDI
jgi:phospholipase C